jgi:DtxR family transcriptional regulator, Mn-dependent transcriptional regulator
MDSLTAENYLKALFHLAGTTGEVGVSELAKRLRIKMPTVSSMMKKLSGRGLVHYHPYKPLRLTTRGRREALLIIRKHRLIELFLVQNMGFRWDQVHDIAEQIEHVHSRELFEKMDAMLRYPKIDPHGEPIPDRDGKIQRAALHTLSTCRERETVTIRAVGDASTDFLAYLNHHGLTLGVKITIRSVEPLDGSMKVAYGKRRREVLSHLVCERLLVEKP